MLKRFLVFGIIGVAAFVVEAAVLWIGLRIFDLDAFIARLLSFSCALTFTYILNRTVTFRGRKRVRASWAIYVLASLVAGTANLGTYTIIVLSFSEMPQAPFIGLLTGTAVGMVINFALYSTSVFPDPSGG